jgi:hypothetical protein
MFRLRLAVLGAAAALALGSGGVMAMQNAGLNDADSHGDPVATAAHSCAQGAGGVHGACVSAAASSEASESGTADSNGRSTAPGQVCKAAHTGKTPPKGDASVIAANRTKQQAFVACVKAHATAESGS